MLGYSDEELRAARIAKESECIDIWPENVPIWDAWLAMENQWRISEGLAGGRYIGLNFPSIPEALDMAGVKKRNRRHVKRSLRYMEGEALAVLNGKDT